MFFFIILIIFIVFIRRKGNKEYFRLRLELCGMRKLVRVEEWSDSRFDSIFCIGRLGKEVFIEKGVFE